MKHKPTTLAIQVLTVVTETAKINQVAWHICNKIPVK